MYVNRDLRIIINNYACMTHFFSSYQEQYNSSINRLISFWKILNQTIGFGTGNTVKITYVMLVTFKYNLWPFCITREMNFCHLKISKDFNRFCHDKRLCQSKFAFALYGYYRWNQSIWVKNIFRCTGIQFTSPVPRSWRLIYIVSIINDRILLSAVNDGLATVVLKDIWTDDAINPWKKNPRYLL